MAEILVNVSWSKPFEAMLSGTWSPNAQLAFYKFDMQELTWIRKGTITTRLDGVFSQLVGFNNDLAVIKLVDSNNNESREIRLNASEMKEIQLNPTSTGSSNVMPTDLTQPNKTPQALSIEQQIYQNALSGKSPVLDEKGEWHLGAGKSYDPHPSEASTYSMPNPLDPLGLFSRQTVPQKPPYQEIVNPAIQPQYDETGRPLTPISGTVASVQTKQLSDEPLTDEHGKPMKPAKYQVVV
jgi:hypothetical protein